MEMEEVLERMGNSIVGLISISKSLGMDFKSLVEALSKNTKHFGKEPMKVRDRFTATVFDKQGNVKQQYDSGWSLNGVTNAGFAEVAGLILTDVGGTAFDYIAIGTGTTAFSASDTALESEVKRKAATGTRVTTSVTNDTAQLQATFSSSDGLSGSHAITESGVLNASSGGTLLCRQVFSALNIDWDAGDSLQITWKIQMQQGS